MFVIGYCALVALVVAGGPEYHIAISKVSKSEEAEVLAILPDTVACIIAGRTDCGLVINAFESALQNSAEELLGGAEIALIEEVRENEIQVVFPSPAGRETAAVLVFRRSASGLVARYATVLLP